MKVASRLLCSGSNKNNSIELLTQEERTRLGKLTDSIKRYDSLRAKGSRKKSLVVDGKKWDAEYVERLEQHGSLLRWTPERAAVLEAAFGAQWGLPTASSGGTLGSLGILRKFGLSVTLLGGRVVDPCLLVSPGSPLVRYRAYPHVVVGGEVREVLPSRFSLPPRIVSAAMRRPELHLGVHRPLLVRALGEEKFLVPAFSKVWRAGEITGGEVDPDAALEPEEGGEYVMGDSMQDVMTMLVADVADETGEAEKADPREGIIEMMSDFDYQVVKKG